MIGSTLSAQDETREVAVSKSQSRKDYTKVAENQTFNFAESSQGSAACIRNVEHQLNVEQRLFNCLVFFEKLKC